MATRFLRPVSIEQELYKRPRSSDCSGHNLPNWEQRKHGGDSSLQHIAGEPCPHGSSKAKWNCLLGRDGRPPRGLGRV